jgi:NADH-quinone oxidoreductase subunit H
MTTAATLAEALIFPGLTFFVCIAFLFEWLERKTAARMQGRIGPVVAGRFGILQPVADFFKLASKEEMVPLYADRLVFDFGPQLFFAAPAIGLVFIPVIGPSSILSDPLDLLFMLFILAFSALMAALLGYSSAGRYSIIATGRLVLQYTGYEIPMIIAMITPAVLAGSLSFDGIVAAQSTYWFILLAPISFACFLVAALAELEKAPFDIPSAKTEIVAGWMTEFSGRALAYVKLTKNLSYVFLSAIAVALFLGGPLGPVLSGNATVQSFLYLVYFLIKLFAVGFCIFAIRTALARVRIDQATRLFWTVITPLSLLQLGVALVLR